MVGVIRPSGIMETLLFSAREMLNLVEEIVDISKSTIKLPMNLKYCEKQIWD